jgi:hypothetical protein
MQRTKNNPEVQALYEPGDLVFFHYPERQSKLQPLNRGTVEVISHYTNDAEVCNIIRGDLMKLTYFSTENLPRSKSGSNKSSTVTQQRI